METTSPHHEWIASHPSEKLTLWYNQRGRTRKLGARKVKGFMQFFFNIEVLVGQDKKERIIFTKEATTPFFSRGKSVSVLNSIMFLSLPPYIILIATCSAF